MENRVVLEVVQGRSRRKRSNKTFLYMNWCVYKIDVPYVWWEET